MATFSLIWRGGIEPCMVSLKNLTPCIFADAPLDTCVITKGRHAVPLLEMFSLRGKIDQEMPHVEIDTKGQAMCDIGYGWRKGSLDIHGFAGDYCGALMSGGEIIAHEGIGHCGGASMTGGTLEVRGNAGDYLACPVAMSSDKDNIPSMTGMNGGVIHIKGSCGAQCGMRQRRGLVVIEGDAGDFTAARMLAGTIIVCGKVGTESGRLMKRGSLIISQKAAQNAICAPFADCGAHNLTIMGALAKSLKDMNIPTPFSQETTCQRLVGDLSINGRGEILVF